MNLSQHSWCDYLFPMQICSTPFPPLLFLPDVLICSLNNSGDLTAKMHMLYRGLFVQMKARGLVMTVYSSGMLFLVTVQCCKKGLDQV